ncbi:hypothetical protein NMG60_11025166 [Bertholletia excelsa]
MVCSLGSGRMATMARLLSAGAFSQTLAEDIRNQKLAAQYVRRELREADEANLLDEEDMHVFGLKPMTDPLQLVCCNACKKPIKASQYTAHAELCRSLSSVEDIVAELDSSSGHKKPPKKERKKLLTAYAGGEQERFESTEADDIATSVSHLDERFQQNSSISMEAKRNSSSFGGTLATNSLGVSPGNTDYPTGAKPPPAKRSRVMAADGHHSETANILARSACLSTQEDNTYRQIPKGLIGSNEKIINPLVGYQTPDQAYDCCFMSKDIPVPLATKVFYSQRNRRLRSALTFLYNESSSKECSGDLMNSRELQGNATPLQVSSPNNISHEHINLQREKSETLALPSVQKPAQVPADGSDAHLGKLEGCTPVMNISTHASVNNVARPQTTSTGIMRSNYLSKPFSFAGNTGTAIRTMQQHKGSVPVT